MLLKKIAQTSLLVLLFLCAWQLKAEEKLGYEVLNPAQPTQDPAKIEVIEFFWYGCPHCYHFEPELEKWVKALPKNVYFVRIPAALSEVWAKHAKAYYVAEALGVVDKVHADLFDAIQNKKQNMQTEEELGKFFVEHGVKEADFHEAYNSFAVDSKMRQGPELASRYGIRGVPALIINGKYKTDGPIAGSQEKILEVANTLIKKEENAEKK